jgi:hypothetical protein
MNDHLSQIEKNMDSGLRRVTKLFFSEIIQFVKIALFVKQFISRLNSTGSVGKKLGDLLQSWNGVFHNRKFAGTRVHL